MYYGNIKYYDISNGDGVRTSLFVSGCNHHCKGCFNEVAWDFDYGKEFSYNTLKEILDSLKPDYIAGLSILGGEPLDYKNINAVSTIVEVVRKSFPNKSIWVYTGYTYEELLERNNLFTSLILNKIDVLVDGKFIEELKDISLKFRGSSNQRIIDMNKTRKLGEITLLYN